MPGGRSDVYEAVFSGENLEDAGFQKAWEQMEADGVQYSESNVGKVHMGWVMAQVVARRPAAEESLAPIVDNEDAFDSDHHAAVEAGMAEPDAPAPDAMRQEFINILLRENPSCGAFRAGKIVDAMLAKQMQFYSALSDEELDTSSVEAAAHVQELAGLVVAIITMGAGVSQYMSDVSKWQRLCVRVRNTLATLQGMVG